MKIVHIVNNFDQGGAEAFVFDFLNELRQRDAVHPSVFLIRPSSHEANTQRVEKLKKNGVLVADRSGFWGLYAFLREENPDVVHCHNLRALFLTLLVNVASFSLSRVVFTQHINFLKRKGFHLILKKYVGRYVAICREAHEDFIEFGIKEPRLIYNGVSEFESLPFPIKDKDKFNVVMIGRFQAQKGHDVFVDMVSYLKEKGHLDRFSFYLVGDGPLKSGIEEKISRLNLGEDSVHFVGNLNGARQYLKSFSALLMTSYYEGLPIVVLEAMSSKVPIVSTKAGGVPDVVNNGVQGYLVDVGDFKGLADALVDLSEVSTYREIESALSEGDFKYSMRRCVDQYLKVYSEVLQ